MLVAMQFVSFVFMGGRLTKRRLWSKAGSDVVVPVLDEVEETSDASVFDNGDDEEEEEIFSLRRRLREKDEENQRLLEKDR